MGFIFNGKRCFCFFKDIQRKHLFPLGFALVVSDRDNRGIQCGSSWRTWTVTCPLRPSKESTLFHTLILKRPCSYLWLTVSLHSWNLVASKIMISVFFWESQALHFFKKTNQTTTKIPVFQFLWDCIIWCVCLLLHVLEHISACLFIAVPNSMKPVQF